jgi:small subunit ribosomal protein S4e
MGKSHIKRINAPKRWDILRKGNVFISRPNAGRSLELAISLNSVIKEFLHKTKTTKESKYLMKRQGVFVNGKRRYDEKFPVGFLDVVSFPSIKENYRLLVNRKDKLFLLKISDEDAKLKLSKVVDKKYLSEDKIQLNCSDGRNFLLRKDDALLKEVKKNDSVLYSLYENKIIKSLKLEQGALVYLYKGKHVGNLAAVDGFKAENIVFKLGKDVFETKKAYAFVVGKGKPEISIEEKH